MRPRERVDVLPSSSVGASIISQQVQCRLEGCEIEKEGEGGRKWEVGADIPRSVSCTSSSTRFINWS